MSELCKNCGKEKSSGRAGSITAYFFEHNYCQCEQRKQKEMRLPGSATSPGKSERICLNCGKSCPEEQKVGSFTAFLFKELRCQCSKPKLAVAQNKRTQVADRVKQKNQTAISQLHRRGESATLPINPGTIIGGTFKISSVIGVGGMGTVYLAQHRTLPQNFALKVLAQNLVSAQHWQRFQAEAKTLAALKHPNLVNVYDLGIHENSVFYYSMDYLEGRNLETILAQEGPQTLERAIEIFLAVLDGLAYAHRNGIVHRDIKPANIFICNKGTSAADVKILDFGIAKLLNVDTAGQGLTAAGEICGSPFYMSPEQCAGNAVDPRSDIYSVGCAMFETLSGFVPFEADSAIEIAMMHEESEPPTLSEVIPDQLPYSVDLVIAKCLAKHPRDRYQSAKELTLDLERIRDGKDLTSYSPLRPGRAEDEPELDLELEDKQNRTALLVVLATILVFAGTGGFLVWNAFFKPVEKPKVETVEKTVKKNDDTEKNFSDPDGDDQFVSEMADKPFVDRFLRTRHTNYSRIIEVQGVKKKQFSFPTDFSMGNLTYLANQRFFKARGIITMPKDGTLIIQANNNVAEYPELLKYFQKDDINALEFRNSQISNPLLMRYISDLTSLKSLRFVAIELESQDFPYFDKLKNLTNLELKLTTHGADLARSTVLPQLDSLYISKCSTASPLIEKLTHCNKLTSLYLVRSRIAAQDCKNLAAIPNLEELALDDIIISDQNLEQLSEAKKLKQLRLPKCIGLTQACRNSLTKFKSLESVTLPADLLTEAQIEEVKRANPKLSFTH